ncbi:MAG TPA: GAF domain-containing protein, partial [Stellaceae bacterium]|nr:GAF domain-containing protein [Stellaceae bacterium]
TNLSQLAQVRAARDAGGGRSPDEVAVARDVSGQRVLSAFAPVEPLNWIVFVELPLDEAYAPLYASIARAGGLLIACLVLAFGAGLFLARRMVGPIQAIRAGAARFGGGDLGQRIAIRTGDELETLADQFNDMAGRLQESYATLERKVEDRTRELSETLEQQTATSEVLQAISSSPGELGPVFDAILENALRLADADTGLLALRQGDALVTAVVRDEERPDFAARLRELHFPPRQESMPWDAIRSKRPQQRLDTRESPDYLAGVPGTVLCVETGGLRTVLWVPIVREDEAVGIIGLYRREVQAFDRKHVELVSGFARQAAIAIENARLLNELRQSLERQTATAEVLGVISSSPGELGPVFETMLENAVRICDAKFGILRRRVGEVFAVAATLNVPASMRDYIARTPALPLRDSMLEHVMRTRRSVFETDAAASDAYAARVPAMVANVELGGARTVLVVPMVKEDEVIGAITIFRQEKRSFTEKQIELVENFAAQAVIAIENARLLTELRDSLERQTATTDVLSVISSSPGELDAVFKSILANAMRICEAQCGFIYRPEGNRMRAVAESGVPPAFAEYRRTHAHTGGAATPLDVMLATRKPAHVHDARDSEPYRAGNPNAVAGVDLGGARTVLYVPMLKEDEIVGVINVFRQEVRPFSDDQIALVENFAAQAVIAIENARLLSELRARTDELAQSVEEQKALGEVTQAVNSTLDLQTVLSTIVAKAVEISDTDAGAIYEFDEPHDVFTLRATYGMDTTLIDAIRGQRISLDIGGIGEAAAQRAPIEVPDIALAPRTAITDLVLNAGFHALLVIPLLRPDRIVGALVVRRRAPGAFPRATSELLQTFAAQSVIAIQNARLFHEIDEKGRELAIASQHKSQFLANMSHELRTPLNAILGYTELILDDIYGATPPRMREVLERVQTNGKHLLGLINDVLDLSKIEAGQLALTLADYSVKELVQAVYVAVEPLASAKALALKLEVAPSLPPAHGDERRLSQVLLNLVGNAIKFTDQGEVVISARAKDGLLTIAVRDTGPGIAESDQGRIFEEFQQADSSSTRAKGGTGLGLAISRRIIALHGGRLWVESQLGLGSTFLFTLPVTVEQQVVNA